ncbi:phage major tail protein, TP901-1 family [Lactobacillus sp. UCMA15818]|uniref:phage major tail protein, TP901-1 family n=1 Tax=Lactobacillus sp. UCMA15818 TaxID=2583394 RepID=UPI0025AF7B0D|nr:phage major tail protein, TP901-1 family [Lactobacillus sp. UCMA15818]MDN2452523.1 phage major tail protein, TP901-1 family [Lactobacillus sp. UCMA15818]
MASVNNGIEYVKKTPYRGKDVWYFIQSTDAPIGSKAILPAHQESGDTSIEGDSLDEQSKMGRIVAPSTNEDSIELTHYMVPGDKAVDIIINAKHDGKQVKVWRVIVDDRLKTTEDGLSVYPSMFGYGVVDSADISDEDSFSELDFTLNILGKLVSGTFPLTDEQVSALQKLYDYERPGETSGQFGETPATAITLDKTTASVEVGSTVQLTASLTPDDAGSVVTYSSSDESIATVDDGGVVTGVAAGSATITATTSNGLTATCAVTVTAG